MHNFAYAAKGEETHDDFDAQTTLDELDVLLAAEARSVAETTPRPRRHHWSVWKGLAKDLADHEWVAMAV